MNDKQPATIDYSWWTNDELIYRVLTLAERMRMDGIAPEDYGVISVLALRLAAANDALVKIEKWQIPMVWDRKTQKKVHYAVLYGSNGERDYMREVARKVIVSVPKV